MAVIMFWPTVLSIDHRWKDEIFMCYGCRDTVISHFWGHAPLVPSSLGVRDSGGKFVIGFFQWISNVHHKHKQPARFWNIIIFFPCRRPTYGQTDPAVSSSVVVARYAATNNIIIPRIYPGYLVFSNLNAQSALWRRHAAAAFSGKQNH